MGLSLSKKPLLILMIGLVSILGIFLFSFSPLFSPLNPVADIQQAKDIVEKYLDLNYQQLEIEEIMEFSRNFYVIAKETNTGNAALELLVDRNSGRVYPEPGPNMMWNTKYGHHQRLGDPTISMPIDSESAVMIAQDWLNEHFFGKRVEQTTVFYGYYTMDFSEKEQIFGMLSVNGYSGDVWHHSWHGDFIMMEHYD